MGTIEADVVGVQGRGSSGSDNVSVLGSVKIDPPVMAPQANPLVRRLSRFRVSYFGSTVPHPQCDHAESPHRAP